MSTKSTGDIGESIVVDYLIKKGYRIIDRNWKTRWCEIDIIAVKDKIVYFVEVKYRSSDAWGRGVEYITRKKLDQMEFAAELWLSQNKWQGNAQLAAASVDHVGDVDYIEDVRA